MQFTELFMIYNGPASMFLCRVDLPQHISVVPRLRTSRGNIFKPKREFGRCKGSDSWSLSDQQAFISNRTQYHHESYRQHLIL